MSGPEPDQQSPPFSERAAVVISQAYYYIVAAVGLAFLLGGAIAALIALRKWLLPLSEVGSSGVFGGPTDSNDTGRSFLGALAFAIPGALVLAGICVRRAGAKGFPALERPGAVSCTSTLSH